MAGQVKCAVCGNKHANTLSWQPFGPSEDVKGSFSFSGSHYRGFPVVKVCDNCRVIIALGYPVTFTYKKNEYSLQGDVNDEYSAEWLRANSEL